MPTEVRPRECRSSKRPARGIEAGAGEVAVGALDLHAAGTERHLDGALGGKRRGDTELVERTKGARIR